MTEEDVTEVVAAALTALDRDFEAAVGIVRKIGDPNQAFQQATELGEILRKLYEASADLRAEQAARIFETERMSLAGLADRIGVSKARAAQLVKTAKSANRPKHTSEDEHV
ncbi:hypothetical protein OHA77_17650 [Streptosporangium sp. NBC_01639]|uniref:hypothetical protein n=1 Tax=Streptosporangium sp. NBC_01639 TaxID=2975948 RepID=UPI0038649DD7|nr:hypothetical protein OHA77_17650 [Streptosporangium sp. NBC_01639]